MKQFLTIALAAVLGLTAGAQQTQRLTASKANEYGLIYTLPVTGVDITVAAEKTVETPGEFSQYARKYLNDTPILAPSVAWRITDVVIVPTSQADPSQEWLVTLKGGNAPFVMVSDAGFPISINDDEYQPQAPEVTLPQPVAAEPTILESREARQAVTPEMIQSRSSVKKAELAANKIYELRNYRNDIISGQADAMPSDGEAMKVALSQIARQEEALTAMFLGTRQTSVEVRTYHLDLPEADGDKMEAVRSVLARLSATEGLVPAADLSGAPIYVTVTPTHVGEMPLDDKGVAKTFPKGGVAYRIPGTADITVTYDGKTVAGKGIDVAQYGVVFGLDPSLFTNKKAPSYLHFNPMTGAVRELGTVAQ